MRTGIDRPPASIVRSRTEPTSSGVPASISEFAPIIARTSSTGSSYSGLPPLSRTCARNASVAGSMTTLILLCLVDEIEEDPLLACGEPGQLPAGATEDEGCRGDVLRTGVHVAEQSLDRAGAERNRSGRLVNELRYVMARPRDVGHGQPHQRLLTRGQGMPAVQ